MTRLQVIMWYWTVGTILGALAACGLGGIP
jgi:hypothetical protein